MEKVRREAGAHVSTGETASAGGQRQAQIRYESLAPISSDRGNPVEQNALAGDLLRLQEQVDELKQQLLDMRAEFDGTTQELRSRLDDLHHQLGN
jgi:hypothetical protein